MSKSVAKSTASFCDFPLSLEAECIYNVGEKAERCRIVDISSQGLGLELDTPVRMQSGQLMLLEINIADQKPLSAITKLAWVQKSGRRLHDAASG